MTSKNLSSPDRSSCLEIGTVIRAHGLRGEIRVRMHDPASEVLFHLKQIFLAPKSPRFSAKPSSPTQQSLAEPSLVAYHIENLRPSGNGIYLVTLTGVQDRSSAETLQEAVVFVEREALPPLRNHEWYLVDVVGWRVMEKERLIGTIEKIEHAGAQNWLVLQEGIWIPAVPVFLIHFEKERKILFVELPEGLLELNAHP